jgi:hypothetical protein
MRRLYLDCDGVLADFDKAAAQVFGMPAKAFQKQRGLGPFWRKIAATPDFFERLDPMPDAHELYAAVRHLRPIILTGLPRGDWAEPQKRRWARRHFPDVPVITTQAALKREHCHPGDVLVDDTDKYRQLWEAEGGVFVHHRNARSSIAALEEIGLLGATGLRR